MKSSLWLLMLGGLSAALPGCSNPPDHGLEIVGNKPKTMNKNLRLAAYTNNSVQLGSRFVSYNHTRNRISIIDALQESEIHSWEVPDARMALPLPLLEGVALIYEDRLIIKTTSFSQEFQLQRPYVHVAAASEQMAYSFMSEDGSSVEVIRYLGNGQWLHDTIYFFWYDMEPAFPPIAFISQFSDDGGYLAIFNPNYGIFTIYTLPSSVGEPFLQSYYWCSGSPEGGEDNPLYHSFVWDSWDFTVFGRTFAGDRNGTLYSFLGEGSCSGIFEPVNFRNEIDSNVTQLSDNRPIRHIAIYESPYLASNVMEGEYLLGLLQDDTDSLGSLKLLTNVAGKQQELLQINGICDDPISSVKLSGDYAVVLCGGSGSAELPLSNGVLEPVEYVTTNIVSGEIVSRYTIHTSSGGFAINPSSNTLYRLLDDVFGTLEITNLLDGSKRTVEGVFLRNILN